MLKYEVVNNESGEVKVWHAEETLEEAEKAHRTLRKIIKRELGYTLSSDIKINVTGENSELVKKFEAKAESYLLKAGLKAGK
jgi:hypothetical protein